MARLGWVVGALFALSVGCGDSGGEDPGGVPDPGGDPGGGDGGGGGGGTTIVVQPPLVSGAFTFYGAEQGLSADIWDASADEGGNVYVAGGDAVFAKRRGDADFIRFDPAAAGLTTNCDAEGKVACPVVSVAGAAPGVAIVGLKGVGTDGDLDPEWQLDSGGADVLAFDGATLSRTRHVQFAGMPQKMCDNDSPPPCPLDDKTWMKGRRKVRQVLRIAVNHDAGTPQYGDVWVTGSHATFSLLVANPEARGWVDLTPQFPGTEDRRYVWEHDHPAPYLPATIRNVKQWALLTGDDNTAIAIDPITGDPWASNLVRTATKQGYGANPSNGWYAQMWPPYIKEDQIGSYMDVWPDPRPEPLTLESFDALSIDYMDAIRSLSFCDDGTLWMASALHGLARRAPDGTLTYVSLPTGFGDNASAVACDPSDGSIWVGFGWGGFGRFKDGGWSLVDVQRSPPFAYRSPVRNIQIDRWASPRIVYFAHQATRLGPGGVTAYSGP